MIMKPFRVHTSEKITDNLCTGCGVCVSESKGSLTMNWDSLGFLSPKAIPGKKVPQNVLKVCPFNPNPDTDVRDEDKLASIFLPEATKFDNKIGRFENTYIGYSKSYRPTSSSGGLATYVFEQLLRRNYVDHLYVVKEVKGTYKYQLFNNPETITKISKTRYIPVTLEKLFLDIDQIDGKIAISGVGCFIKAIRLKQYYHPDLKEKIPFLIGIICGGWKSQFFSDFLSQSSGISNGYHHQEYRIKDVNSTASDYSYGAYDNQGQFHQMKMAKVGDMWGTGLFKAKACDFCTDVTTELADISLGDAWLPEYREDGKGNSIIITRSLLADQLVNKGIEEGDLKVKLISKDKIIQSQKPNFSHRRDAIKFRLKLAKLKGLKTPYIRKRTLISISLPYKLVQLQRERTRKHSLTYWKLAKNVKQFNLRMKRDLKILGLLTKIYHKLR